MRRRLPVHPAAAFIGTISGVVTNDLTGAGVRNDKVALYNSSGSTIAIAHTSATGYYQFGITQIGTYVVRQFTPKRYVQTSPTFTNLPPAAGYPFQSPINISAKAINLASVLKVSYTPNYSTGETIAERSGTAADGVEVGFVPSNSDYVTAGGTVYQLTQFHFHSPSEDRINGKSTNVEIHFVNQSADGGISVLAVFVKLRAHNYALDPILKAMNPALKTTTSLLPVTGPINFAGLLQTSMQGWYYQGSLTTAPVRGTAQLVRIPETDHAGSQPVQVVCDLRQGRGFLSECASDSTAQWPAAQCAHPSSVLQWRIAVWRELQHRTPILTWSSGDTIRNCHSHGIPQLFRPLFDRLSTCAESLRVRLEKPREGTPRMIASIRSCRLVNSAS